MMKSTSQNTSIVCVVRNRNDILADSFVNWLRFDVPEFLIVDFRDGSCERAKTVVDRINDSRVRLIETLDEYQFHRTAAYNLGFSQATHPFILKLDVDYLLSDDFFERNTIDENSFISGHFINPVPSLTGLLYLHRNQFEMTNGFHERMLYYGREDVDFSDRLAASYVRHPFVLDTVVHKEHSDTLRIQSWGSCSPEWEREILMAGLKMNELIEKAVPWSTECQRAQWNVNSSDGIHSVAVRTF